MSSPTISRFLPQSQQEVISLSDLLNLLWESKVWLVAFTLAGLLLGGFYGTFKKPSYELSALVQVEGKGSGGALGATLQEVQGIFDTNSEAVTEIELIQSNMVLGRTIKELNLTIDAQVRYVPIIGSAIARHYKGKGIAPGFGPFGWGGESIEVTQFDIPEVYQGQRYTITQQAHEKFEIAGPGLNKPYIGQVGRPVLLETAEGPMALFVRDIQARPGTQFRVQRLSEIDAIDMVRDKLMVQEKVKQSNILKLTLTDDSPAQGMELLNKIASNYVRQNVERKSAEAEQTLKFLNDQLPTIKKQLDTAESSFNAYRASNNAVDVDKEGSILLQESVAVERQLVELQSQRKELLGKFTAANPRIQTLDSQIGVLQARRGSVGGRVDNLPKTQQQILRLTRDLKVNTEMYNNVLNDTQQLRVAQAGTVGNVRVVDYAMKPKEPKSPTYRKSLGLGLFFGFLLGTAVIFVRSWLLKGVKDAALIESTLGLTVLATIPESTAQQKIMRSESQSGSRLLVTRSQHDLAVEGIRSLRTALYFSSLDRKNNCTVLTGPSPGIGKTFLTVSLAALQATNGARVLVIDADMRRGHMHDYFAGSREGGLSEVIAQELPLSEAIRNTAVEGLDFMSTGVLPPNPSELLLHPRFAAMLEKVSADYDAVFLDSPPMLAVTDAVIIGRLAGATLLVARYGQSLMTELETCSKRLEQANVLMGGVILNRVERSTGYRYHYEYQTSAS